MTIDPIGTGDTMGFKLTANGLNARIPQAVPGLLAGEASDHPVDAHGIQPLFAGMLARVCGLTVGMAAKNGEGIVLTAEPDAKVSAETDAASAVSQA
jgi:histidine phosphotransferase ChpT